MSNVVGRKANQIILNESLTSIKSGFVAIYYRRRMGKAILIRQF